MSFSLVISNTSLAQHKIKPIKVFGGSEKSSLFNGVIASSKKDSSEIQSEGSQSIGDAVQSVPGVNSSGFSPSSTRPIIRGLDGERIRVLIDELGTLDVSGTSADHVVPISPLSIETIEVVRGPIALLYGSSALGGVVNVVTSRNHDEPFDGFSGAVSTQFQTVNNLKNVTAKLDYGVNDWIFHFDGNFLDHQDLKVPTSEEKIANSSSEQSSINFSASKFYNDGDQFKVSFTNYENLYGVVAEDEVIIDSKQDRFDFVTKNKISSSLFESMSTKTAFASYTHNEIEDGGIGTTFDKNGLETRIEFNQKKTDKIDGLVGLHVKYSDLEVEGDEAFLPSSKDLNAAAFSYEEYALSDELKFSFGSRLEFVSIDPINSATFSTAQEEDFFLLNGSLGSVYTLSKENSIALNLSYNQRNPLTQELFSNGAHLAIGIFENGNSNLEIEESLSLEMILKHNSKNLSSSLNLFVNRFNNFIALNNTGVQDDTDESGTAGDSDEDFFIFDYSNTDALFYGAELNLESPITKQMSLQTQADFVIAKDLDNDSYLPRITPPRASIRLNYRPKNNVVTHIEARHTLKASNTAINETETDAYTLINLGASMNINLNRSKLRVFAQINNLFDEEARNHSSYTKDIMQIGGINLVSGIEASF